MDDRVAVNRAAWDERVPLHLGSRFYDLDGFREGRCSLRAFELDELGPVDGLDLVHLQCHFGQDTLSWARRGARVTGIDFSTPAIDAARDLASELGLDARFVVADVHDALEVVEPGSFDVVYTGLGALVWLPDLRAWAEVVAGLLRPGGVLYLAEFHPICDVFAAETLVVEHDYFTRTEGMRCEVEGSYVDWDAPTVRNVTWEWTHPVSSVIGALLDVGLVLELFHEHDWTLFERWPFLEADTAGGWHLPTGTPRLPLMYSLRARLR